MFVFADALTKANADKLKDFMHKKDKIFLDPDFFAAVGPKVSKKEFVEGKKAGDKDDHLIQNKNKLYYDDRRQGRRQAGAVRQGRQGRRHRPQGLHRRRLRHLSSPSDAWRTKDAATCRQRFG